MYCSKEKLKDDLKHYLSGYAPDDVRMPEDAPYMDPDAERVIASFESVDYDMDVYVKNRVYESLGNDKAYDILTCVCLIHVPTLEDLMTDWYNGYVDITLWSPYGEWSLYENGRSLAHLELLRQLYFCDTYESFWLFVNKHGNIEALYKWYQGISTDPEFEKLQGIPCYCEPKPELVKRFEAFFDIQPPTPEKHGLHFSIEDDEFDRWGDFLHKHQHKEVTGRQGSQFEFHFYNTGFGVISSVKCLVCGEEETLTDLDKL